MLRDVPWYILYFPLGHVYISGTHPEREGVSKREYNIPHKNRDAYGICDFIFACP